MEAVTWSIKVTQLVSPGNRNLHLDVLSLREEINQDVTSPTYWGKESGYYFVLGFSP